MIEMNTTYKHLRYIEKLMRGVPTTQAEFECYFRHLHTKEYPNDNPKPNPKANQRPHLLKTRCDQHQS